MTRTKRVVATIAMGSGLAMAGFTAGCGGGGSPKGSNDSGVGSGMMLYSCTVAGDYCTQLIIQSTATALSAEQANCANEGGTNGTGCSPVGIAGCCLPKSTDASKEEQCFYNADQVAIDMIACPTGHTWSTTM